MTKLAIVEWFKSKTIWTGVALVEIGVAELLGYGVPQSILVLLSGVGLISLRLSIADLFEFV